MVHELLIINNFFLNDTTTWLLFPVFKESCFPPFYKTKGGNMIVYVLYYS